MHRAVLLPLDVRSCGFMARAGCCSQQHHHRQRPGRSFFVFFGVVVIVFLYLNFMSIAPWFRLEHGPLCGLKTNERY